jgi:hypothetical protein
MSRNSMLPDSKIPKNNYLSEARFYMEDSNWDFKKAVELFKKDLEFEYK